MISTQMARVALAASLAVCALPASAQDWSRFRGPNGSGVSDSPSAPVEFGPDSQVLWQTDVPFGRSSPVIGGRRIFLSAVEGDKLVTLAIDRESGEVLWRRELERRYTAELHQDTDSATPSPVTDGENVYVFFHEAGLVSYDASGRQRWQVPLGPFRNYYGCASSPVVAGDLVIVICDQAEGSFLLAVDAATGGERWRANRPARLEGYATPILYPDTTSPRLVLISGSRWIDAYDLATGKSAWSVPNVGTGPVSSPVLVGDTLFVSAQDHAEDGWPEFAGLVTVHDGDDNGELSKTEVAGAWLAPHFGWLDTDASGAISAADWKRLRDEVVNDSWGVFAVQAPSGEGAPEILWNYRQNVPYIPSPLVYDGIYYMIDDGIVTALDAGTGELLKRARHHGEGKVYASPVAAAGKIYVPTLGGQVVVLSAAKQWDVLATNEIGEPIHASPAILDGRIYLRTASRLYCFGDTAEAAQASSAR